MFKLHRKCYYYPGQFQDRTYSAQFPLPREHSLPSCLSWRYRQIHTQHVSFTSYRVPIYTPGSKNDTDSSCTSCTMTAHKGKIRLFQVYFSQWTSFNFGLNSTLRFFFKSTFVNYCWNGFKILICATLYWKCLKIGWWFQIPKFAYQIAFLLWKMEQQVDA